MTKKNITFLFGAGAEGTGNFDLPTGYEYLKNSLFGNEYHKDITDALKKYFSNRYYGNRYTYTVNAYSNATAILKNLIKSKILNDNNFLVANKNDIAVILSDVDFKELSEDTAIDKIIKENSIEHIKNQRDRYKIIESEFRTALTSDMNYSSLTLSLLQSLFQSNAEGKIQIDLNVGIGGLLDGYFYTITSPMKYGAIAFSKIFNYYWMCYFSIVDKVVKYIKDRNCELNKYYQEGRLDYYKVLKEIKEFTHILYDVKASEFNNGKNYYSLIKNKIDDNADYEIKEIATTNYYKFCELITDNVIYLNGNLKKFEFPEFLEVEDADKITEEISNDKIFFPFIFGQSHVKPIVHPDQTNEFNKFKITLDETDVLVILGYNINEDDDHINAFIHHYIKNRNRVIVVGTLNKAKGKQEISKKLRCNVEDIEYCTVVYGNNAEIINKLMKVIKKEE